MELTWGQILGVELNDALNRVMHQPVDYSTALKILSLTKELKSEQVKAQEMRAVLQDRFFDKISHPDGRVDLREKLGKEDEIKKAQEEFANTRFKLKSAMLAPGDLIGATLTPVELMALEPLIAKPPEAAKN